MSDYEKICSDLVFEGFSTKIAVNVVVMVALNHAEDVMLEDVYKTNAFTKRLEKKFKKVLWELSEEEFETCYNLWKVHHDYTTGESMDGLGGCKKKTYKQLIKELHKKS